MTYLEVATVPKVVDPSGAPSVPARAGDPVTLDRAMVEEMALALIDQVPDAPDSDGSEIIARLLDSDHWEELNMDPKLPNGQEIAGVDQVVQAIARHPSDLDTGDDDMGIKLPYYLVVDAVRSSTGAAMRWQTSAPALVVPLTKLYLWHKFPATVCVRKAEKPTKRGFYPLNLQVIGVA